ncbi:MAG: ATP-binding protein [Elusimicrobia bacterium]|nr:ATP-binding protein [Elusimicrobiota bacterium]
MIKLADNQLFRRFSAESRRRLAAAATKRSYRDGAEIFDESSVPESICLIASGEVQLVKGPAGSRAVVLATVGPGDYFGEIGVMYRKERITGARAKGPVVLYKIPEADFRKALACEPPAVTRDISAKVVDYLRAIDEKFVTETLRKEKIHLIGELAGSIIHDFKNPLTSIRLAGSVIQQEHQEAETRRCCQIIQCQAERMAGMAQQLLDFARGHTDLKIEALPLADLFEEFRTLNQEFLSNSRVTLRIAAAHGVARADRARLLRVLQNLVGNSVDALAAKGGSVWLEAARQRGGVRITVRDDGPGIPAAIRGRVFEPFFSQGKKGGSGLGLTIAKSLVEAHGGRLTLEFPAGRGTTFRISLPGR